MRLGRREEREAQSCKQVAVFSIVSAIVPHTNTIATLFRPSLSLSSIRLVLMLLLLHATLTLPPGLNNTYTCFFCHCTAHTASYTLVPYNTSISLSFHVLLMAWPTCVLIYPCPIQLHIYCYLVALVI